MSLWIRLISVFLLLDIALFAVTAVATMIYAERTVADMAALIEGSTYYQGFRDSDWFGCAHRSADRT